MSMSKSLESVNDHKFQIIGKAVLADGIKLKISRWDLSGLSGLIPNSITSPYKTKKRRQLRREGSMKAEADGMMWPWAKECQ